jgi:poly(A) polymerase
MANLKAPKRIPFEIKYPESLQEIVDKLQSAGAEAYLVGGAVRDSILGKIPKDFDIATNFTPERVIEICQSIEGSRLDLTGKQFGVVRIKTADGAEYEIATFRVDVGVGRRPDSVNFATIEEDVLRRDLTINALFYDFATGEIVDYVGGVSDLKSGIIRTVGDPEQRFAEDYLRILRTVRFAARFGSKIDAKTAAVIRDSDSLNQVSPERVFEEFEKSIETAKDVKYLMQLLSELNLLPKIFPALKTQSSNSGTRDVAIQTALVLLQNDPKLIDSVLKHQRFPLNITDTVCLLISLVQFDAEKITIYMKEAKRIRMPKKQIFDFFQSLGNMPKEIKTLLDIFDMPPAADSASLMASGVKGQELGVALKQAEIARFKKMLQESVVLLKLKKLIREEILKTSKRK